MAVREETLEAAALDDLRIIDADSHITEPADLWTARVAASVQDQVPVQGTVDGVTAWYLDGAVWASTGGNTIVRGRQKELGTSIVQPFDRVDQSAWSVKERLELLDECGILAQILYPNAVGFSSNHVFAIEDPNRRAMILQTYNDFFLDVQTESNGRLFPQAMLPIWDMDLTVSEMTRLIDRGITGFTLSDKPELLGLPELPEPYFDPMWDLFNESGAVANFHIGSGARREEMEALRASTSGTPLLAPAQAKEDGTPPVAAPTWRTFGRQRRLAVGATQGYMSNVRIIVNLCMSNLFDRFPRLRIVSAESGVGWVPFVLEAMEYQFDEMVTEPEELNLTERRPAEYFREHISVMFWFEDNAPQKLLEDIGIRNVLVETDVPHPTCLYPNPQEHFARVLSGLDAYARQRVLRDNAAELYRIPVPAVGN